MQCDKNSPKQTTFGTTSGEKIAIIAGKGDICFQMSAALEARGYTPFIMAYHGMTDPLLTQGREHLWFHLGQVGRMLEALKQEHISKVVMIGTWQRPSLRQLRLDIQGVELLASIGPFWRGDDYILQKISDFLEKKGLEILAPQDIIPGLFQPLGALGNFSPDTEALQDLQKASALLTALSTWDFGQGVAIQQGLILAIEAAEGTDACIQRAGALKRSGSKPIYVKMAKKGQSYRVDLPVIGLTTLQGLVKAEFQGLAFQATSTLVVSPQEVRAYADQHHVFLWGF